MEIFNSFGKVIYFGILTCVVFYVYFIDVYNVYNKL